MRLTILLVLVVTLLVQSQARSIYVTAGLGVDGIAVGYSTKNSVTARYGEQYQLVEHNKYSYEMKYEEIGMSFWGFAPKVMQSYSLRTLRLGALCVNDNRSTI